MVQNEIPKYKIVIIGCGGVGKTCYVKRFKKGNFLASYVPTVSAKVHNLVLATDHGKVHLEIWDTAGQERIGGMREGYFVNADGAIVMFDVTSKITYTKVDNWIRDLHRVTGAEIPCVLVGNKCDIKDRKVHLKSITIHRKYGMDYYDISAKSNYQYEKPFLSLLKKILGVKSVKFTEEIQLNEAEIIMSEEQKRALEKEREEAKSAMIKEDTGNF